MNHSLKSRWLTFLSLLVITALGLLSKFYSGFGYKWVNNYAGGIFYEIFWCLFLFFFTANKLALFKIPILVFCITCVLEILQLGKVPFLETIRATLIGRLLLGTTFSWLDFLHYMIGCLIGYIWLQQIQRFN